MKRLIISGDRNYRFYRVVEDALRAERHEIESVIEGECPYGGADLHARNACVVLGIKCHRFPADWKKYGRGAGPVRNREMLKSLLEYPGERELWAFHCDLARSRGTKDMLEAAHEAGIPCRLYSKTDGSFEIVSLTF